MTVRLGLVLLLGSGAAAGELHVSAGAEKAKVSVVRRVELDYYLLKLGQPLEFEVEGPTWLRVYTRVWWPDAGPGKQQYGLSLWQDDVERPLDFEVEKSSSSFGPGRRAVGRWRSFYIQVPGGRNPYRLELNHAPAGVVGVRFSFQQPRTWQEVGFDDGNALTLVGAKDTVRLYRLDRGEPLGFDVTGPCRCRVRVRLNFDPGLFGAQNFRVTVREQGQELASNNFRVGRSSLVSYSNAAELVPSSERTLKFSLGAGRHRLTVALNGTLAQSAGIRVERLASEKYE